MKHLTCMLTATIACCLVPCFVRGANRPELQPLAAQAARVVETIQFLGEPLADSDKKAIADASASADETAGIAKIQEVLDRYCLVTVQINPESRVKAARGSADARLVEQGWRTFLVKVNNEAGVTAPLGIGSPHAMSAARNDAPIVPNHWLGLAPYTERPMTPALSGLGVEYRVLSLFSRDPGQREAKLSFDVGQGTQDLGFRSEIDILFTADPARQLTFHVIDDQGRPATASFVIRDRNRRPYPWQINRGASESALAAGIQRADGDTLKLPIGEYEVEIGHEPEYRVEHRKLAITAEKPAELSVQLKRKIAGDQK